jgi:ADP-ribosylglycohydrolase
VAPARAAGATDERANGNGSLMRVLPLALWHQGSDEELVRDAHAQSLVTHGHPRSQVCCALYCLWARRELAGAPDAWAEAVRTLRGLYGDLPHHRAELSALDPEAPPAGNGTGYVVYCLRSARLACEGTSYADVVRRAIALGHDTDTTACVAGGIAGIRFGKAGIPPAWAAGLRDRGVVESFVARLGQHAG